MRDIAISRLAALRDETASAATCTW